MPRFDTLSAALAAQRRDDREIVFIDGEDEQRSLSFARLERRALAMLGALQRRGVQAGSAMLLFVGDNERFLEMFWACVLGGIVPVPLAAGAADEQRRKLFRVFAQHDEAHVYTEGRVIERLEQSSIVTEQPAAWSRLRARTLAVGALDIGGAAGLPVARAASDIAFIQYSSGSTSEPKGVVLTHANLCANIASIAEAGAFSDRDVALSWMPLSHDMGLIGFHLNMLACGATHAIMRTDLFARRPLAWLDHATRRRATVLCSPNFGYQHYLRQYTAKPPQGLDLSAVRLIFNGAEPISASLARRFVETLAPHGLRGTTMFPVYGLAEASLAVTFPRIGAPLSVVHLDRAALMPGTEVREQIEGAGTVDFVKLGWPVPGTDVRIAGPEGSALPVLNIGRVCIRGDNVTAGYWHDEAATRAAIEGEGWLDTGDLGYLAADGQLVLTGRAKDIIFVSGQNVYPHDLERIVEQATGVELNRVAAAGVPTPDGEGVAVFVQHRGELEAFMPLAQSVRQAINGQTGLEVAAVVPVLRMPKTTSGKLQRHALARAYVDGEYAELLRQLQPAAEAAADATAAGSSTAMRLKAICDQLLPETPIALDTNLLEANLNSLTLARIHEEIDRAFPQRVELTDLFDYPTLAELASFLDGHQ